MDDEQINNCPEWSRAEWAEEGCKGESKESEATLVRWSSLLLYTSALMLQSDQNLLSPHLTTVAEEFGMDKAKRDKKLGGQLAMGLFLIGMPSSLALGRLGDVANRKALLVATIAVGAIASLGTASATSFVALFWWRALTGVSLGGSVPVTFSLLGDLYPRSARTSASGRLGVAMSAGQGLGLALSGLLGARYGWRAPFVVVGAAFAALAVVVVTTMSDLPRGRFDSPLLTTRRGVVDAAGALAATPSVWLLFAQGIPGCVPWSVLTVFMSDYLHADLGLSVEHAAAIMALFTAGVFAGLVIGGELGQRLYNWRKWAAAVHAAAAEAASPLPLVALFVFAKRRTPIAVYCPLLLIAGIFAGQTGVIVKACLQNVVAPTHRSLAFGAFAIFDDIGKGGGPVVVAHLVAVMGRRRAFTVAIAAGWLSGAAINALLVLTLDSDEARLRWHLADDQDDGVELTDAPPAAAAADSLLDAAVASGAAAPVDSPSLS